jgi:hypothetical protein
MLTGWLDVGMPSVGDAGSHGHWAAVPRTGPRPPTTRDEACCSNQLTMPACRMDAPIRAALCVAWPVRRHVAAFPVWRSHACWSGASDGSVYADPWQASMHPSGCTSETCRSPAVQTYTPAAVAVAGRDEAGPVRVALLCPAGQRAY